ncbi:MAG: histidine triad nucleotide-binding protein [Gammaproteobacteria bacterium]|nr:histidine triad nucleotide-binding protein [Gammaproteobacteria bacterium]MCW8924193.1 histidine triad nucleotide-binding protein [Gammaproteobacteria bacterium]
MSDCLFCKILDGEIPCDRVYENEHVIAFRDVNPQAPTHVLVIPHQHISTVNDLTEENKNIVGEMMLAAQAVAKQEGIEETGYRLIMNCNEGAGQTVFHIHLHILGGRIMRWPPG